MVNIVILRDLSGGGVEEVSARHVLPPSLALLAWKGISTGWGLLGPAALHLQVPCPPTLPLPYRAGAVASSTTAG